MYKTVNHTKSQVLTYNSEREREREREMRKESKNSSVESVLFVLLKLKGGKLADC